MATNDQSIEAQIQAKGKTAPRITPADIDANIASEHYFTAGEGVIGAFAAGEFDSHSGDSVTLLRGAASTEVLRPNLNLLTFCILVLRNGFTVTGESACASPENFDAEIGRNIARQNAVQKIWPLMGYELRSKLSDGGT
ncbi:MAG: Gp49 family protein [Comamonas sp.]|nr:Gp49 family protein [Comamonas sp.]